MKFSFIVCAHNEEGMIGSTLRQLIKTVKRYGADCEILVGISGTDRTADIAKRYARSYRRMKVFTFGENATKTEKFNPLLARAKGEIIINHDSDRVFVGDLKAIERTFSDKKVGGLVFIDPGNRDSLNEGQRIFEHTYEEVKLKRHSIGNKVQDPVFTCYIFRKSALGRRPKLQTTTDDFEVVDIFLSRGYRFIYDKRLAEPMLDNPLMRRITPSDIMRRRMRAEISRAKAKQSFKRYKFPASRIFGEALTAFFVTATRTNLKEFLEVLEYLLIVSVATANAKFRMFFMSNSQSKYWSYRFR